MNNQKRNNRINNAIKQPVNKVQNNENNVSGETPDVVTVKQSQLNELIEQNAVQKDEIGALVGLFMNFEGLFKGDAGIGTLLSVIPKLLSDEKMKSEIEAILPIIEKYKS